jgi:hypothetical protein
MEVQLVPIDDHVLDVRRFGVVIDEVRIGQTESKSRDGANGFASREGDSAVEFGLGHGFGPSSGGKKRRKAPPNGKSLGETSRIGPEKPGVPPRTHATDRDNR